MPFGGVVVNKVRSPSEHLRVDGEDLRGALLGRARLGQDLAGRAGGELRRLSGPRRGATARNINHLAAELRTSTVIRVPYLDEDVHDLAGLSQINRYLFASSEERVALAAGEA